MFALVAGISIVSDDMFSLSSLSMKIIAVSGLYAAISAHGKL